MCEDVPRVDGCPEVTSRSVALGVVRTEFYSSV